ncbi:MAG: GAF domain-containing protein, partial [Deltaproteobacteria bacterium]|nr:GAF domain-containing protein [Deltaproteobacteria bacterium]
ITNPKGLNTAAMEALNAIGDHLRSKLDSLKLAQTSLAEINRILHADLAVVYLRGVDDVLRPLAIQSNSEIFSKITLSHHRLGQCLCGLAAAGEIACSDNIHQDYRCTNNECKEAGILSFAALPLRYGEDIIGVLSLAFTREQDLAASRVLMETMADLLAMGLHNTLLFEKIERYAAEQEEHIFMLAMNAEINGILTTSAADLPAALRLCCDLLVKTMRAASARVWMLDSAGESLELKASAGMHTHLDGYHSPKKKIGDDKISQIFQTQRSYVNNDISGSPLIDDREWGRREGIKAFTGMPLFVGDNVAGVLGVFSKNTFSELNVKGLRTAADSISLWIEQKTMEQRLWKQTKLFEAIFNAVPDAFIFADSERKIQLCNQGFVSMFGYSDSEVVGLKTKILYADEADFERQGCIRFNPEAKGWLNPYEINFKRRDGTVFPSETIGTVVRTKDEKGIIGYLSLIRDVTRRKEAEKHQRHMQKMEALGTLSGGIAHDFNNLLNVISGFTNLTLLDLQEGSLQYRNLREVKNASKRAAGLVKQILSFSRGLEEELRPMAIPHLIKEVVNLLFSTLPATIQVKQYIEPCGMVLADTGQIHQVLMNLCTNAFHAMRQTGGVLEIGLRQEEISTVGLNGLPSGNYALVTVSDTGCGMSDVVKERIFEPYFTTKEQEEGTGLGLATVHGIIKAHGGMITVESELNKGSVFSIHLPIIDQRAADGSNEMDGALSLPEINARVLLVDDVRFNVDLGSQLLERTGCTVRGMTDSTAALALFREAPDSFDLVLTDQTMPVMTGFEMARKMLKIRSDLPIIMVSGHSELVDEQAALGLGIRAFIYKPLSLDALFEAVTKALGAKGRRSGTETKGEIMTENNLDVDIEGAARAHLKKKYKLPDDKITPMLAEVRKELPKFIAQALDDNNHHNWPRLAASAHAVRGQLLTLGFDELGEMARVIELGAKAGEDIDYSEQLRHLNSRLGNWKAEGIL